MILTSLNSTDERIAEKLRVLIQPFYLRHSSGTSITRKVDVLEK